MCAEKKTSKQKCWQRLFEIEVNKICLIAYQKKLTETVIIAIIQSFTKNYFTSFRTKYSIKHCFFSVNWIQKTLNWLCNSWYSGKHAHKHTHIRATNKSYKLNKHWLRKWDFGVMNKVMSADETNSINKSKWNRFKWKQIRRKRQKILLNANLLLLLLLKTPKWPVCGMGFGSNEEALKNANFMTENTLNAFDYDVIAHKTQA